MRSCSAPLLVLTAFVLTFPFLLKVLVSQLFSIFLSNIPAPYFPEKYNCLKHKAPSTCWIFKYKLTFTGFHSFLLSPQRPCPSSCSHLHPSTWALNHVFSSRISRNLAPSGPFFFPVSFFFSGSVHQHIKRILFSTNK